MTQVTPSASSARLSTASTPAVRAVLRERIASGRLTAGDWLRALLEGEAAGLAARRATTSRRWPTRSKRCQR